MDTPTQVGSGTTWSTVSAGYSSSCAIRTDGTLWCWGYGGDGQLGLGDTTNRTTPVQVGAATTWVTPAAGEWHTCASGTGGSLSCWGANWHGQLGLGDTTNRTTPSTVTGPGGAVTYLGQTRGMTPLALT